MVRKTELAYSVSERRACRVLAHPRATHRYESVRDDQAVLRSRIKEIAGLHVTWGYPRIWIKLRREGWAVNRKRVYRLYRDEGLCVGRHTPRRHKSSVTSLNERRQRAPTKLEHGLHGGSALRWPAVPAVDESR